MNSAEVQARFTLPDLDDGFLEIRTAFKTLAQMVAYRPIEDRHKVISIERLEEAYNWALKGYEPDEVIEE